MSGTSGKSGFTLIEILIAVAMIAVIVSMVYGSYSAASKSTQACRARIALLQQMEEVLGEMSWQIRCSYAGATDERVGNGVDLTTLWVWTLNSHDHRSDSRKYRPIAGYTYLR